MRIGGRKGIEKACGAGSPRAGWHGAQEKEREIRKTGLAEPYFILYPSLEYYQGISAHSSVNK